MVSAALKTGAVASAGVMALALAGCGSSQPGQANATKSVPVKSVDPATIKNPNARHVDPMALSPDKEPEMAAQSLGDLFAEADATDCGQPTDDVDGYVSNKIWDTYTCRMGLTLQEVRWHCSPDGGGVGGNPARQKTITVSRHPLTKRMTNLAWQAFRKCPGHGKQADSGTYNVTVTQLKGGGWIAVGFKILRGPGAGTTV